VVEEDIEEHINGNKEIILYLVKRRSPLIDLPICSKKILMNPQIPLRLITGYAAVINTFSFGLFWYDKRQALQRGWRVPEKQLQFTALMGGWLGGILAMQKFKHKTVKQEFRIPFFACMGANIAAIGMGYQYLRNPKSIKKYLRM
jgi:uncharacterized membrane protein YsdA (DUF1294 family)